MLMLEGPTIQTYQGHVSPGMCDVNGHMNVTFYAQIFDSACWHLLGKLAESVKDSKKGWADVQHTVSFLQEIHAGAEVIVNSNVANVGKKSLTTCHFLQIAGNKGISAKSEIVSVRFDLDKRCSTLIEPSTKLAIDALLTDSKNP